MPVSPFVLETLRTTILSRFPELADGRFSLLADGWDSVAVDVDDRLIFKFPRHPRGEEALRREVAILDLVGPAVSLTVPSLTLYDEPQPLSRHLKIPGGHLLAAQYDGLDDHQRQRLGEELGLFYSQLHEIEPARAMAAGAVPVDRWLDADEILRRIWPVLPEELRTFAEANMAGWAVLSPDPLGTVYGFFDGHGWNMAFDQPTGRLNGIYDFADSGIGPLHQEFIYSNFIAADLTERIIAAYQGITGRPVERDRVDLLTGTHRLWELAEEVHLPDHVPALIESIVTWAKRH